MPTTKLTDKDVVSLMKKDFDRRLKDLCDQYGLSMPTEEDQNPDAAIGKDSTEKPENIDAEHIDPGIRVVHRDSQLEYHVVSINLVTGHISLENSEGKVFPVKVEEFESDYALA